jgi:hypothetical protein
MTAQFSTAQCRAEQRSAERALQCALQGNAALRSAAHLISSRRYASKRRAAQRSASQRRSTLCIVWHRKPTQLSTRIEAKKNAAQRRTSQHTASQSKTAQGDVSKSSTSLRSASQQIAAHNNSVNYSPIGAMLLGYAPCLPCHPDSISRDSKQPLSIATRS